MRRPALLAAVGLACVWPADARAQRVLDGRDAVVLPRGALRVSLAAEHAVARDRWRDGRLEGLGGSITTDAFGPLQFSLLAPVEQQVRDLGVTDFAASLGTARLDARQRAFVTPLAIEYGLTDRITLGARATLVRTKGEALFRLQGDSGRATLGINPILGGIGVAAGNATTIGAYTTAATNLAARRDACQANAGAAAECPTILAQLASVNTLIQRTNAFATGLTTLYGAGIIAGRRWVPFAGSAADSVLLARVDSIRTALTSYGITDVTPTTGLPAGALAPLAAADVDQLLADSLHGYGARPLNDAGLTQVGDVYLTALVRVHDSFVAGGMSRFAADARGWRQAVLVEARIGTSYRERPDRFLDQGTGAGRSSLTVRSLTDVVPNARFWVSVAVGVTHEFAGDVRLRVPSTAGGTWLESWREADVAVTPGTQVDLAVTPRWHLGDHVLLGADWQWRVRSADHHAVGTAVTTPFGDPMPLVGRILDDATRAREHRVGVSATYSTLASRMRGRPGMPFEITYRHDQSVANAQGVVPRRWEDRVILRYYPGFRAR